MGELCGRYVCIEEFIVYCEMCYEGSIVEICKDSVSNYYMKDYYASWLSEGDIKRYFRPLNEERLNKIKHLLNETK